MRALVQRVARAEVRVEGQVVGAISRGILILLGVAPEDDVVTARRLARRVVEQRIHADADGRTNLALAEIAGSALVVSQFTLYADTRRGRRPGFTGAAEPAHAAAIYEGFCAALEEVGVPTERGRFGSPMEVELVNDGPFTLWLDTADR